MNADHVREACKAHSDINILEAVIRLLEGSLVSPASSRTAGKIVGLAKAEQQRALRRMDAARAKAAGIAAAQHLKDGAP